MDFVIMGIIVLVAFGIGYCIGYESANYDNGGILLTSEQAEKLQELLNTFLQENKERSKYEQEE